LLMASSDRELLNVRPRLSASPDKRTKPMRSVKFLVAAGAASLLSSAAFAADMPSIMPAPQPYYAPPAQDFGGWYLRGDIGMTTPHGTLDNNLFHDANTLSVQHLGHEFTSGTSFGVGVGYQFN